MGPTYVLFGFHFQFSYSVPEPICATKIAIGHRSMISFRSVIDPSNRFLYLVIASRDHRVVNVFYILYVCFLCQFYKYLYNVIDLNINLYFYFTFLLFKNRSYVILLNKTMIRLVNGHRLPIR